MVQAIRVHETGGPEKLSPATREAWARALYGLSDFAGAAEAYQALYTSTGAAPAHATFRAASASASRVPCRGSSRQNRPLPSSETARARFVPFTRTTPGPSPAATIVFVRTM